MASRKRKRDSGKTSVKKEEKPYAYAARESSPSKKFLNGILKLQAGSTPERPPQGRVQRWEEKETG